MEFCATLHNFIIVKAFRETFQYADLKKVFNRGANSCMAIGQFCLLSTEQIEQYKMLNFLLRPNNSNTIFHRLNGITSFPIGGKVLLFKIAKIYFREHAK